MNTAASLGTATAVTRLLFITVIAVGPAPTAAAKRLDPNEVATRRTGGINLYSLGREVALGREMAADVEREARLIDDPVISEYVNRLGQNIVLNSDAKVRFTIKVIQSDEVNALALPGGYMFVNSGTILAAANEAELAGVLAHEVAHVAARHATRRATQRQIINVGTAGIVFMGGWPGVIVRQGINVAAGLALNSLTRRAETEADVLGIQYMCKAGYDPSAFIDFLEKLTLANSRRQGLLSRIVSTHPSEYTRIRAAQKQIQRELSPRPMYVLQTVEFDRIRQRLIDIQSGRNVHNAPPQSAVQDRPPVLRRRDDRIIAPGPPM